MSKKVIVVGDIHGCFDTFKELEKQFPDDATISLVGDLVDRGPKSMDVVQHVINKRYDCVRGNHEQMMIDYFRLSEKRQYRGS